MSSGGRRADHGASGERGWDFFYWAGQSLTLGYTGFTPQPDPPVPVSDPRPLASRVDSTPEIVDLDHHDSADPPGNFPEISFGHEYAKLATGGHRVITFTSGIGGAPYHDLKRGTTPWAAMTDNLTATRDLSRERATRLDAAALCVLHGTAEITASTPRATYASSLVEWISDFTSDAMQITDQATSPVMLIDQVASVPDRLLTEGWEIAMAQYDASRAHRNIHLANTRYQYPFVDGVHLFAAGYTDIGRRFARVASDVVENRIAWQPLWPISVVATSAKSLSATFHVPDEGSLLWGTPFEGDYVDRGFSYTDGGPAGIESVRIASPTTVEIELNSPASNSPRLSYGRMHARSAPPGRHYMGGNLYSTSDHWCVLFEEPVT